MTNRENALIALRGDKPESVPCFYSCCQIIPAGSSLECPPMGSGPGYDGYGVHQTPTESAGGMYTPTPGVSPVLDLDHLEDWKKIIQFPDYGKVDFKTIAAKEKEFLHLDKEHFVQDLFCPNGIFERIHFLMGFEDAMIAIMEEPEIISDIAGAIADKKIEFIYKAAEYYKPDYFTFLDDYAHKDGLFISRDTFREIFRPHYQRIIDACNETDMIFKTHCCGKMEFLLDDFLDMGVTAFDPVQCVNNIPEMKKKTLHKAGIMGGLDVQNIIDIPGTSEEAIRQEVRRCIDEYAQGGGYMIYGASLLMYNPASYAPGQPLGIVMDECEKYGHNYYK